MMRIEIEGIIVSVYTILVLAAAAYAVPHMGKRGGLEYVYILFVSAPTSFLFAQLLDRFRQPGSRGPIRTWVLTNGDMAFLFVMSVAGLLQAILLFFAIRWLRGVMSG